MSRPAVLIETDLGNLTVDCLAGRVGENFVKLCKAGVYCNNLFYSISAGFVAQCGDPTGTGKGGSSIWGLVGSGPRFFSDAVQPESVWRGRGLVCMASYGGPHTNASAFYLVLGEASDLRYRSLVSMATVVGRVVDGLETLDKLSATVVDEHQRPFRDVRIRRIEVLVDPYPDPEGFERACVPARDLERYAPREETAEERLSVLDVGADDALDPEAREARRQALIAETNAVKLEMLGDLPSADFKPMDNVLFVCKLNPSTRSEDLELIFSRFGTVLDCEVIRDQRTQDSLQYAFVEISNKRECEEAYRKMQNVVIDDRRIKVDFSQSTRGGPGRWAMRSRPPTAAGGAPRAQVTLAVARAAPAVTAPTHAQAGTLLPAERRPRLDSTSSSAASSASSSTSDSASKKRKKQSKKKKKKKKKAHKSKKHKRHDDDDDDDDTAR